jgi:hypothetical protein
MQNFWLISAPLNSFKKIHQERICQKAKENFIFCFTICWLSKGLRIHFCSKICGNFFNGIVISIKFCVFIPVLNFL